MATRKPQEKQKAKGISEGSFGSQEERHGERAKALKLLSKHREREQAEQAGRKLRTLRLDAKTTISYNRGSSVAEQWIEQAEQGTPLERLRAEYTEARERAREGTRRSRLKHEARKKAQDNEQD